MHSIIQLIMQGYNFILCTTIFTWNISDNEVC